MNWMIAHFTAQREMISSSGKNRASPPPKKNNIKVFIEMSPTSSGSIWI
jgi:hypothetical protein